MGDEFDFNDDTTLRELLHKMEDTETVLLPFVGYSEESGREDEAEYVILLVRGKKASAAVLQAIEEVVDTLEPEADDDDKEYLN